MGKLSDGGSFLDYVRPLEEYLELSDDVAFLRYKTGRPFTMLSTVFLAVFLKNSILPP